MCAQLVDSAKQGLTIKPNVRQSDNELFGKLPVPYWMDKDNGKNRPRTKPESNGDNFGVTGVMDLLCITIEKEMNEVFRCIIKNMLIFTKMIRIEKKLSKHHQNRL